MCKRPQCRTTFASWHVEKVHAVVAWSTFPSQKCRKLMGSEHFWTFRCRFAWQAQGIVHRVKSKVSKTWGLCSISRNDGRRGTFEGDLQRYIFRSRFSTRNMFIRDVRRSGCWFPERGCILEHQIFRFAEMILRDRRSTSTSYDLASLLRGRRNTLETWTGKITKRIGTRPSALHSTYTFHFWIERSLAELFRFWCCQLRKMRKSRRIISFLTLSSSKIKEVSQN